MNLAQIRRYFRDDAVSGWRKLVVVAGVAYLVFPIDLVPDVVPLLGWLDDLGVLGAALTFFARDVASHAAKAGAVEAPPGARRQSGVQVIDATPVRVRD
jgi:uncharacterized membrane protein YkvA (DUF1232 family)